MKSASGRMVVTGRPNDALLLGPISTSCAMLSPFRSRQVRRDRIGDRVHACRRRDAAVPRAERDQVALARGAVPGLGAALLLDVRLVARRVVLGVDRVARFEQQATRDRGRPLGLAGVVARVLRIAAARGGVPLGNGARHGFVTFELRIAVVIDAELVLRVELPGETYHLVLDPLVLDTRADLSGLGEVAARNHRIGGDAAPAGEEPELVPQDGAAEPDVDVAQLVDARAGAQALGQQFVGDVVGLPVLVAAAEKRLATEDVAAVLRNHVDAHAARGHVRRDAARLVGHFGHGGVAEVGLHLPVVHQAVQVHAVHLQRGVGLA